MDKTLGFLGILNRGKKILIGESAYYGINKGYYAFLAFDCSRNTEKEALKSLKQNDIPLDRSFSKKELGSSIGYNEVSFMVVLDKKATKKLMDEKEEKQ